MPPTSNTTPEEFKAKVAASKFKAWPEFAASPTGHLALQKAGKSIDDVKRVEINEAFSSVALNSTAMLGVDPDKVNVNGGAIALGHPLGCSGTKLMATLLNELERTGGRYGLQTMCEGGGMANATIIERL